MPVIVCGAHRSGTSALTKIVVELGASTGGFELLGANSTQPLGHYEPIEILRINDRILSELGGHWMGLPGRSRQSLQDLATGPHGLAAREAVQRHLDGRFWVMKDPRFSILLPFWREVLNDDFSLLISVRDPNEVAQSLVSRDQIPHSLGLMIWQHYNTAILGNVDGLTTRVVDFGQLVADPTEVVNTLLDFVASDSEAAERAAATIDPTEPNSHRDAYPVPLSPAQKQLWSHLRSLHGAAGSRPEGGLPEVDATLLDAAAFAGRLKGTSSAAARREQEKQTRINELAVSTKRLKTKIHELTRSERKLQTSVATLEKRVQQQADQIHALNQTNKHVDGLLRNCKDERDAMMASEAATAAELARLQGSRSFGIVARIWEIRRQIRIFLTRKPD